MRLRAPHRLEQDESAASTASCVATIAELPAILADEDARLPRSSRRSCARSRERFGDDARTEIVPGEGELDLEQLIREEDMVISITHTGYIKRIAATPTASRGAAAWA